MQLLNFLLESHMMPMIFSLFVIHKCTTKYPLLKKILYLSYSSGTSFMNLFCKIVLNSEISVSAQPF